MYIGIIAPTLERKHSPTKQRFELYHHVNTLTVSDSHIHTDTLKNTHTHTHTQTHTQTHMQEQGHVYRHTHAHTCLHIQLHKCVCVCWGTWRLGTQTHFRCSPQRYQRRDEGERLDK